mgnify:CR=1 FL=1
MIMPDKVPFGVIAPMTTPFSSSGDLMPKSIAALSYPYAVEHDGKLYVGYSNSGDKTTRDGTGRELWNNNSAELAIIPIEKLK